MKRAGGGGESTTPCEPLGVGFSARWSARERERASSGHSDGPTTAAGCVGGWSLAPSGMAGYDGTL